MSDSDEPRHSGGDDEPKTTVDVGGEFQPLIIGSPDVQTDVLHKTTTPSEEGHKPPHLTDEEKAKLKAHVEHITINRTPLWIAGLSLIAASLLLNQ